MQALAELGVDTKHVHYSKLPTATFSVITDKNDCQVGGFYPGAMGDADQLSLKRFAEEDLLVVVSAHDPAQMGVQIAECKALQKRLCFDIGQQVSSLPVAVLTQGLAAAEILILNDYEMGMLAQRLNLSQAEIISQVPVCVITLGDQGSQIYTRSEDSQPQLVSAVKVTQVVDPTGAGDAFRAGFLYGYVRNWPVATCAQLGSTVAAYVVESYGTQTHHFTLAELKARYQATYHTSFN
jgi:adenosine kinase